MRFVDQVGISMRKSTVAAGAVLAALTSGFGYAKDKPTIVLVHGAFAESGSWSGVIAELEGLGYPVIAAANPLRSVAGDATSVGALVKSVSGPVVLVGHSYGGPVITDAAAGTSNVKALVYVSAFAPDVGESSLGLTGKFPGSTLGDTLHTVPTPDGGTDLFVLKTKFHAQFAADVPASTAATMATTQRPVAKAALEEPTKVAAWKTIPNWWIYGSADKNIPPAAMAFMAERSKAHKAVRVEGGSHALMVSHPHEVAQIIEEAAAN